MVTHTHLSGWTMPLPAAWCQRAEFRGRCLYCEITGSKGRSCKKKEEDSSRQKLPGWQQRRAVGWRKERKGKEMHRGRIHFTGWKEIKPSSPSQKFRRGRCLSQRWLETPATLEGTRAVVVQKRHHPPLRCIHSHPDSECVSVQTKNKTAWCWRDWNKGELEPPFVTSS